MHSITSQWPSAWRIRSWQSTSIVGRGQHLGLHRLEAGDVLGMDEVTDLDRHEIVVSEGRGGVGRAHLDGAAWASSTDTVAAM